MSPDNLDKISSIYLGCTISDSTIIKSDTTKYLNINNVLHPKKKKRKQWYLLTHVKKIRKKKKYFKQYHGYKTISWI
jgi:hypothetical protein